jgi:hypothetical protein
VNIDSNASDRMCNKLVHRIWKRFRNLDRVRHRHTLRHELPAHFRHETRSQVHSTLRQKGSKYGLWSGNRVFLLEPQDEAAKFAAENVEVHGTMANGMIQIKSINVAAKHK